LVKDRSSWAATKMRMSRGLSDMGDPAADHYCG
jgi:hypothetical protein